MIDPRIDAAARILFGDIDILTAEGREFILSRVESALAAAQDDEIMRLRAENERLRLIAYSGRGSVTYTIHSPVRFIDEERKVHKP